MYMNYPYIFHNFYEKECGFARIKLQDDVGVTIFFEFFKIPTTFILLIKIIY